MHRSRNIIPCGGRVGKPYCHGPSFGGRSAHTLAPSFARPQHPWGSPETSIAFAQPSFPFGGQAFGFGPRDFGLGPFMRDVDELARFFDAELSPLNNPRGERQNTKPFNPKFDVQEDETGYELRGELPGVESKDLDVKFVEPKILVIRGETTTETTRTSDNTAEATTAPEKQVESAEPAQAPKEKDDDAMSTHSQSSASSYVQPTVEDAAEDGEGAKTPATATGDVTEANEAQAEQTQQSVEKAAQSDTQQPQPRYWISERSSGSFQRTFRFPSKVNQDGVTASLKNGVLSVRVPKAEEKKYEGRQINVE